MSGVRCWNDIGIWGNSTCEKLGECVHCVNCGVYSDAAKELFERKIPSDYFDEWAESMERARGVSAGGGGGMFLFGLCGRLFALPSEAVSELASMRMIHKIPYRRGAGAAGLANIDGELVPTVDLAGLFGLDSAGGQFKCLVVCLLGGEKTAFPADFAKGSVSAGRRLFRPRVSRRRVVFGGHFQIRRRARNTCRLRHALGGGRQEKPMKNDSFMLELFLREVRAQCAVLRGLPSGGDAAAGARAANSLKGAARMLGFSKYADVCEKLENFLNGGGRVFDSAYIHAVETLAKCADTPPEKLEQAISEEESELDAALNSDFSAPDNPRRPRLRRCRPTPSRP